MNTIRVVEIGGTHIRRGDVINGEVSDMVRRRTAEVLRPKADQPRAGSGDVLGSLDKFCRENWTDDIEALAILVAGPIRGNIIECMPNFPDFPRNINLAEKLDFNVPIFVFNDMTAAVVGMAKLLKDSGIDKPFWGLTWSTGLGGKFWDGAKIAVNTEVGHEIKINGKEAEELLGGRHLQSPAGPQEIVLMNKFLEELKKIAPTNLFVMKGAIAQELFANNQNPQIMLSPEPEKDSFIGAWALVKKAV